MNFRITVFLSILIGFTSGCFSPKDRIEDQLLVGLTKLERQDFLEKDYVVIIPRIGCLGCISSVEQFLMDHAISDSFRLGFLLIDIISLKAASIRFGKEVIYANNVLLDRDNDFDFSESVSLYPVILELDDGHIVTIEYVSPESPYALDKLIENFQ